MRPRRRSRWSRPVASQVSSYLPERSRRPDGGGILPVVGIQLALAEPRWFRRSVASLSVSGDT